jgi:imidazoleglycerol-phosphate dehydratase
MTEESGNQVGTGGRRARVERRTAETEIVLVLDLDGEGTARVDTGVGFFDHMLTLLARHGLFDLAINAQGDLETGAHHTVEDVGICLGRALDQALGDKAGIVRYGDAHVPMDESLAHVALDLSGRPYLAWQGDILPSTVIGGFDTDLALEFFQAVTANARLTAHVHLLEGSNPHHMVEAVFKAFARALRVAAGPDPRRSGIPSTKGVL